MGLDLGPATYRTEVTDESWPKCFQCSKRLGRLYPVEACGILTREPPSDIKSRYKLVLEAKCHGQAHRFTMECPRRWGLTAEQAALGCIFVFMPGHKVGRVTSKLQQKQWRDLESAIR